MTVFLVGEAAAHIPDLRQHLVARHELVELPAEAGESARYDARIGPDDVVVSLRWRRPSAPVPAFRLLHVPGAGLDRIDLAALDRRTAVANVYEHEVPIAEYVLARLLEWEIRAESLLTAFSAESWPGMYANRVPHGELHGRTLGILGYGRIGRAIAERACGFGVRVIGIDTAPVVDGEPADGRPAGVTVVPVRRLADVLGELDYLVIACPLTPGTEGLVDHDALHRMASSAVLVNVSRAEVVAEDALYAALRDRVIAGAVLDVWYRYPSSGEPAPPPATLPFWELPNAWCTPHSCAWTTQLSRRRYAVIAENINRLAEGRPLRNLVRAGTR